jgi:nucleotide-binding universal stress UspA family protein
MSPVTVPEAPTSIDDGGAAERAAPIVAAVDGSSTSRRATAEAVRLAVELEAPVVFVYVRRGPGALFGEPVYQRRLNKEMIRARNVLRRALETAESAGVPAEAELLEGSPGHRIAELARARDASLVVVGSRRRRLGRSVSSAVVRDAGRPVVVARAR